MSAFSSSLASTTFFHRAGACPNEAQTWPPAKDGSGFATVFLRYIKKIMMTSIALYVILLIIANESEDNS